MNGAAWDTLVALVEQGPLWDGNVPSKQGRDWLVREGLAAKILVRGEDGYQAATYKGAAEYRKHFGEDTIGEAMAVRKAKRAIARARL
jgi:hypothetical protein